MLREIQEIQNLATKYSKSDLGRMVQLGLLDPQKAMMAGMMIQRIEQQNAQPPQSTVAQDLLGMPPVPNQPMPQAPQGQMPMPPMQGGMPPQMAQPTPGIEALPAGSVGNYADGGIVAFADKGLVEQGGRMSSSGEYVPPEYVIHSAIEESKKPKTDKYDPKSGNLLSNTGTGTGDPTQKGSEKINKGKRQPKQPGRWEGTYATKYDDIIENAASKYGVDPKSMWRLLYTESAFNPKATSYAGKKAGYGIAQISHHHKLTDKQMEDPKFAIEYATKYFAGLLKKSDGDYRKALEKYKGVVTEDGRRRMASAIDKVLASTPVDAPIVKPSKLAKLAPGETPTYPVPPQQIEVRRLKGKPTQQELIEQYRAIQAQSKPSAPIKPIGEPLNMTEEYNRDAGGWFYPEDLVNHPEFFSNYANGGITSLANSGVPRYAGASGSWVQDDSSNYFQDPFGVPDYSTQFDPDWLKQKVEEGRPYDPSLRGQLFGYKTVPQQKLPPIASPSTKKEKELPPVEVVAKRIVDEPEEEEKQPKAAPAEQESQPARRGFGLPPISKYKVDLPVYTGDVPERTSVEAEREKRLAHEKAIGYNPEELYNGMIAKIEEQKGDYASDRDKAIGQAIMMAGFKLMGARRGQEFENLSEGAQEGLKFYQASMRDFKARQDRMDERADAYRLAKAQALRTGAESDIARFQHQEDLYYKAQQDFAKAKNDAEFRGAQLTLGLRDQDKDLVLRAMADKTAKEVAEIQTTGRAETKDTLPALVNAAIDDWNKMDIIQRKNMEKNQGIKTEQDYVNYRLRMVGKSPIVSTQGWGDLKVTGGGK